ncbi:hypothetical protein [Methyloferula stellata]|uniref:hypothetical protein n=1 Tax=Methyloferula stellata TaxID=876270 RepID=UPI000371067B|nr:hypothetical protein [Methyloferula stellata]
MAKHEGALMRYLGGSSGSGVLQRNGEQIARASYDFESYSKKPTGVASSGEIRLSVAALENVFGCDGLQLLTDDGRLLDLKFSDRKLLPDSGAAHVDVTGESRVKPAGLHHQAA